MTRGQICRPALRLAFLTCLCLAGCGDGDGYTFRPGEFDPDRVPGVERLDAAAAGDPDAQFHVAFYRHTMTGDHAAAVAVYRRLAEAGHRDAAGMLAAAYRDGRGVAPDYERAAYWLRRAAALGDRAAARDLAAYRRHQRRSAK